MKPTVLIRICVSVIIYLLSLLAPANLFAQTFHGIASNPNDNVSQTNATVTIIPPGFMQDGDLVVIYAHYRNSSGTLDITTEGGQTWTRETAYTNGNQRTRIFWCRYNGGWGANPVVTRAGGSGTQPLSAVMYVYRPNDPNSTWGKHAGLTNNNATGTTVSITGLATTVPNTVTMAFWGNEDDVTWGTLGGGAGWVKPTFPASATQIRNTGGSQQSHTAAYNIRSTSGAAINVSQVRTGGASVNTATSIICFNELPPPPPANDLCANATPLTSTGVCSYTSGTLAYSTYVTTTSACGASSGNRNDVWYSFTALSPNPTITLASAPVDASLQLYSGICTGLTSVQCVLGGNTLNASGLTVGNVYRIRVFSNSNTTGTFDICVTDPAPANDLCAGAIPLNSAASCANITGTLGGATYTTLAGACGASGGDRFDVWYSFVAKTTNPTITLSSPPTQRSIQLFSGSCGSLISEQCVLNSSTLTASGLIIGNTYYVRIFSDNNTPGTFSICVTDPVPANNECAGAVLLTSGTSCSGIQGGLYLATNSSVTITAPNCATTVFDDVWYRFVAQTTNPTITLNNLVGITNPGIQLLSNNCAATYTSFFCSNTNTLQADFLVPGTTYYIRVYSTTDITALAGFDICITDPVALTPPNDDCNNAINLLISASCSNVPGTVAGATNSGIAIAPCTGPVAYDVWYKFTAVSASSTITLSGAGSNFNTPRLQLFSGTCGSLTSLACGTTTITNATVTGTTYYVRVYSTTGPAPNGNANFNICVAATGALLRYGNSYVNISRKTTGGVVQPGDTLEIRMTINHVSASGATIMYRPRYVDNLPTNTSMVTGAGNFLGVITNEGLSYRQYTLAGGDDGGTYNPTPGVSEYNIRMNLHFGSSATAAPANTTANESASSSGTMTAHTTAASNDRPRGGGGMLFATAFRVRVEGAIGDSIILNPGQFIYRTSAGGSDITLTGIPFKIIISDPLTLCSNSIGVNVASEYGGTFGSGTTPNRTTDLTVPITGYSFISNMNANNTVGDGRYAIVKNMSPRNRTVQTARREPGCGTGLNINDPIHCNNRMYGHWYIDGDHTGTNDAIGNLPPTADEDGGYMLMVNADYVASEIYRQSINNLCPNTYYEFSAWIRNICATCGADSTGAQFAGTPTAPAGGYPGVYPNLTFALDNLDYYNTGEVDTLGWLKKGFVFKTGPSQTSASFSIRNNSQGGGGNDWVLDDIAVATCFPNMTYSPSAAPNVCEANVLTITDTVRSYFDNYVEYKWERSTGGPGGPWSEIPGATGTATPTLIGGVYQFVSSYTIPPSQTTPANNGDLYRLVVASTPANLTGTDCSYTDPTTITITVLTNCTPPLKTDLLSVSGRLHNDIGKISWVTSLEDEQLTYSVERSNDGVNFYSIAMINGYNDRTATVNHYNYSDPVAVTDKVFYRVVMLNSRDSKKYSSIIQLNPGIKNKFDFGSVTNPFRSNLQYEISSTANTIARVDLIDGFGKIVKSENQQVYTGSNSLSISNTSGLSAGIYVLRASINGTIIYRKVMKN